ncbi:type I methionyl aminopeptidase [Geopsychrobacter electrodiphilus]|uniref:type I methionyl aminopeptidase n=1 Tax=Geopsychrobacter electrodiphilus TaxID=225196 RepID=UPI00037526D2|nr:type I methionyl aminopeptidase [Geopsychrobacter electrodiphilus]
MIVVKTSAELERMRNSGRMVAEVLELLGERIAPGVTTLELDRIAEEQCLKRRAIPAFKGYGGFPFTICASPNDQVVHGFPNSIPLVTGDIISIDFGLIYEGFYGDSAYTFAVGKINGERQNLLDVTKQSLKDGIAAALPGGRLSDISHAVQSCAEAKGYGIVREFVGHGIGRALHEDPQVPNYGPAGRGPQLKPGMTLAIEPMVNFGSPSVKVLEDGWTAVTIDGGISAHFEHTVAITDNGPEILTKL